MSGYWVLVSHNPYAKTAFIGADGSVISFSKYFISTKTNFLPKQYSLRYISYEMDGKTFKDQAVIILSKGDKYNDWMRDGYAVTKISADSLKLVPTYMIQGSLNPKEYTFKRVRKE
ncbi:hypothetical protein [Pedobacter nototheniae]|uniref:hypothetical protein n=1 Tax=Pedobacter nototheniae TaxID=2488994 RepID=UPI001040DC9A|nr:MULTISPECIES: hypothetical protein [Pedobacter]